MEKRPNQGLGRLCADTPANAITAAPAFPGIERIEACFAGDAFEPHRHDTYALGVTLQGVQTFHYRGQQRFSLPGNVIILHPDEEHDGGAGTETGLRYRMLYLEPSLLLGPLGRAPLPFVAQPVANDTPLRDLLLEALTALDQELEELFVDDLLGGIARGLLRQSGKAGSRISHPAERQVRQACAFLAANTDRGVRSGELERLTGLDRFELARHFRALCGTSPHRFQLMRRLQQARRLIVSGTGLAEAAAATGFVDQSHMNRHFKKAFGMAPGRWANLVALGTAPTTGDCAPNRPR
jgi:AraC-like DNA-binding protein